MKTRIIIDSTCDLMPDVKERCLAAPLTVHFGEEVYVDGVSISHRQFYEKLIETDVLPHTSKATPAAFGGIFEGLSEDEEAVVITVSSKLSGTYQSACIAAADYPGRIFVVDSTSAAIGAGILAELALRLADEGLGAWEIASRLTGEREKICVIALLDTLEYLKKGGRISRTVAFAGGVLNIKPVACIEDGEIRLLGKARGSKQGNNLLATEVAKAGGVDFEKPVLLGYTGLSDALLLKYMEDSRHLWAESPAPLRYTCIGSVIGTHAGPGAVACAFFRK